MYTVHVESNIENVRCRWLVNYGSERESFPLPEEARRAELIMRRRTNYEAMTGDHSLSEICAHLRKTRPREKGKPISAYPAQNARKSKLHVYAVLRETPRWYSSEKTKMSNTRYGLILFLTARETVTLNSLLEESNPARVGVNVQGITFQYVNSVALGKCPRIHQIV